MEGGEILRRSAGDRRRRPPASRPLPPAKARRLYGRAAARGSAEVRHGFQRHAGGRVVPETAKKPSLQSPSSMPARRGAPARGRSAEPWATTHWGAIRPYRSDLGWSASGGRCPLSPYRPPTPGLQRGAASGMNLAAADPAGSSRPQECSSMARAPVSKTGGCRFESCHSCQSEKNILQDQRSSVQSVKPFLKV